MLILLESKRFIECIYNGGCTATEEITLPSYIQAEGSLVISNNSECEYMTIYKQWYQIHVEENICNDLKYLTFDDSYPNLIELEIGSQSLQSVETLSLSIPHISIIDFL